MRYFVSATAVGDYVKGEKFRMPVKSNVDLNKFTNFEEPTDVSDLIYEKVIKLSKVSKVVKGGRRYKYCALVVVGNLCGKASVASAKASDAADAVSKAVKRAMKLTINSAGIRPERVFYKITGTCNATKVVITPTREGAGVRAGNVVKAVLDAFGVSDISAKLFGSTNSHNVIGAIFNAFEKLQWHQKVWSN
ncbi:MAG: hypothetical protein ACEY26_00165 [Candidatus Hodgkinia cicadicola]